MSKYVCESLGKRHDRNRFDCGVEALNDYLVRVASQDVKRKAAAVFVMTSESEPTRIVGYYTLCSTSIELTQLPLALSKRMPRYPEVPAILVGRLAGDLAFPGLGSLLLADALIRCVRVANEIAATLIVVDIKNETVGRFYERHGFVTLPKLSNRMFLPIATAEKIVKQL
ncbi:MAG: GNAT family N-acetyltransferase [Pirellulaceae bacterium]|nr:GNAT family N-acetyltransferase [Pirellulaceae bacterium]